MRLRPEYENRVAVAAAFGEHREAILGLVPEAEVEHIGATAVPGSLTKGDLDLLVRVEVDRFEAAIAALGGRYSIHQPENWNEGMASFKQEPDGDLPIGVQLVVGGGEDDRMFIEWRERLIADRDLLGRYNAVKQEYADSGMDAYREAKAELIASS